MQYLNIYISHIVYFNLKIFHIIIKYKIIQICNIYRNVKINKSYKYTFKHLFDINTLCVSLKADAIVCCGSREFSSKLMLKNIPVWEFDADWSTMGHSEPEGGEHCGRLPENCRKRLEYNHLRSDQWGSAHGRRSNATIAVAVLNITCVLFLWAAGNDVTASDVDECPSLKRRIERVTFSV